MIEKSDRDFIQMLNYDPHEGFRPIYQKYSGPLFRFIYRFTGNSETTEEILHDVFSELLLGKYKSQENAALKDWLYTLAKNKSLNFNKKASFEVLNNDFVDSSIDDHDLESQTIGHNLQKVLSLAEKSLPSELLETWSLKKQGYDHQAIGQKLSIPVGTVKSRFHRIVELLRKEIG